MAKKKGNLYGKVIEYTRTENGSSIGRRPKFSSMNKNKKSSTNHYYWRKFISSQNYNVLATIQSPFIKNPYMLEDKF